MRLDSTVTSGTTIALLAQQFLRHKSSEPSLRAAFWGTVWLNVGAFLVLSYPTVHAWERIALAHR